MENIIQLQQQLQSVPDQNLRQALSQPGQGLNSLLMMLESDRRAQMRSGMNTGMSRPNTMRDEMAQGMYQPVPSPTIPSVEQGGIAALMPQASQGTLPPGTTAPQSGMPQPNQMQQPQGLAGL